LIDGEPVPRTVHIMEDVDAAMASADGTGNTFMCWEFLRTHEHLRWRPPAWRDDWEVGPAVELCAVERNLVIHVEGTSNAPRFRLLTGPLRDLTRGDSVDPFTPVMTTDERIEGVGATLDEAIISLAASVRSVYGDGVTAKR
jgi:hypothetical protein